MTGPGKEMSYRLHRLYQKVRDNFLILGIKGVNCARQNSLSLLFLFRTIVLLAELCYNSYVFNFNLIWEMGQRSNLMHLTVYLLKI